MQGQKNAQPSQPSRQYHKWTDYEAKKLFNLAIRYSEDWVFIKENYFPEFTVQMLKNKYAAVRRTHRIVRTASSVPSLFPQKEEQESLSSFHTPITNHSNSVEGNNHESVSPLRAQESQEDLVQLLKQLLDDQF